ncbi:MAG: HNH endonuclease [Mesorhizobium sp.]|nr:HNH endonuclease [Mesorhizobium sp.]
MATFLIKANCELHLNGAEPRPTNAEQWEGAIITVLHPRTLDRRAGGSIAPGDGLIVWTHEDAGFGRGLGLTAKATVGLVAERQDDLDIRMVGVELVTPQLRLDGFPAGTTGSDLIDQLRRNRHRRTIVLDDLQVTEFWNVIAAAADKKQALIAQYKQASEKSPEEKALEADREQIAEGFERRLATVEARPEQAAFRKALMGLYGVRCLISGNRVAAVLQAAHIVPFSTESAFRNEVANGLLLRADLHLLFDKMLIAIHPDRSEVVIADSLEGTSYERLTGRKVRHQASTVFLSRQYKEFCSRPECPRAD